MVFVSVGEATHNAILAFEAGAYPIDLYLQFKNAHSHFNTTDHKLTKTLTKQNKILPLISLYTIHQTLTQTHHLH